ncbi:MAG: NUDIX domain-containing protein, partial [Actinomycetia bacterium]|nr:NUDIX domain-containing protein [Actinomycetes bacterium]
YYNGLGGKMDMKEIMETPLDACYRELYEESGLEKSDIEDLKLKGVLTVFDRFGEWLVFEFAGRLADTTPKDKILKAAHDEGKLEWVNLADIETIKLVPDLCNGHLKDLLFSNSFSFLSSKFNENDEMVESQVIKI